MRPTNRIIATSFAAMMVAGAAHAQALKFSTVGKGSDPDVAAMEEWASYIEENSDLEVDVFPGAALVEQGKQGQALARGTADAAYMSPGWLADDTTWGILATPYLLRSPEHVCAFIESDLFEQMVADVEETMDLKILDAAYQGTRTLNLREEKDVQTPADLEGMSLRVVPSPENILMGEGLGANPTPVPFSELYLALQTGTVDAQENPLTLIWSQKFYEVTEQIVNTQHKVLIQFPAFSSATWEELTEEQRQVVREGAAQAMQSYTQNVLDQEASLQSRMEEEGITFTDPDREAFRTAVQEKFVNSDLADAWDEGLFERIANMEIPSECSTATN